MFRIGTFAATILLGWAVFVFAQESLLKGVGEAKKTDAVARTTPVRKALGTRIEIPVGFKSPLRFGRILSAISELLAAKNQPIEIVVDSKSFREEIGDGVEWNAVEVNFPMTFFPTMTAQEALTMAIDQLPSGGTFLIVNGRVEIMTREAASIRRRLNQPIASEFSDVPLKTAIEELAERAGVTIMIDPRCAAMNKAVTLQGQNDTSLRGILSSWADMYDLKMLVDEHRVLLMPRADYMRRLRDQAAESELMEKIGPGPDEPRDRARSAPG